MFKCHSTIYKLAFIKLKSNKQQVIYKKSSRANYYWQWRSSKIVSLLNLAENEACWYIVTEECVWRRRWHGGRIKTSSGARALLASLPPKLCVCAPRSACHSHAHNKQRRIAYIFCNIDVFTFLSLPSDWILMNKRCTHRPITNYIRNTQIPLNRGIKILLRLKETCNTTY